MDVLETLIRNIDFPTIPKQEKVDLAPLNTRIIKIEEAIRNIRFPTPPAPVTFDLTKVYTRLEKLDAGLKSLPKPAPQQAIDLKPLQKRVKDIEELLKQLLELAEQEPEPEPGPQFFAQPTIGKPDDLERVSGIGPKLERMLNGIGVWYFWQISSWSPADIEQVDDMLEVFKGRILRDDWVPQARLLAAGSPVQKPAGRRRRR